MMGIWTAEQNLILTSSDRFICHDRAEFDTEYWQGVLSPCGPLNGRAPWGLRNATNTRWSAYFSRLGDMVLFTGSSEIVRIYTDYSYQYWRLLHTATLQFLPPVTERHADFTEDL